MEDPNGVVLYEQMSVKDGTFAFTAKAGGDYKTCFTAKGAAALNREPRCPQPGCMLTHLHAISSSG